MKVRFKTNNIVIILQPENKQLIQETTLLLQDDSLVRLVMFLQLSKL